MKKAPKFWFKDKIPAHVDIENCLPQELDIEVTSWLVSAYDIYSRVVKDR